MKPNAPTANPLTRKFLAYLQHERNFSDHTIRSYTADLTQFVRFLVSRAETPEPTDGEGRTREAERHRTPFP